jgi:hypothetical protein
MSDLPKKMTEALDNYYKLFSVLVGGMYRGVVAELGEEKATKVLLRGFHETGILWGKINAEYTGQSGAGDAKSFAEAYAANTDYYGFKSELVDGATPKRAIVRLHRCPIQETLKPFGLDVKVCDRIEHEVDVGTAKFVNPKIKLTVTKSLARGDPYCEYIYELED